MKAIAVAGCFAMAHGNETPEWVKGGDICALGILHANKAPEVFLCNCGEATECKDHGVYSTIMEIAGGEDCTGEFYDETKCSKPPGVFHPHTRRFWQEKDITAGDGTYAFMTDGISQTTGENTYWYIGAAYYIAQTGSMEYNVNTFIAPDETGFGTLLADICVVPGASASETSFGDCGPKVQVSEGDLKFAFYGGPTYPAGTPNGFAKGVGGGWVRTLFCYKGLGEPTLGIADGQHALSKVLSDKSLQKKQLKSISLGDGSNFLSYTFPQEYVYGNGADCTGGEERYPTIPAYQCPPSSAHTMQIRVAEDKNKFCSQEDSSVEGFFIDYYVKGVGNGHYFVYDPQVSTKSGLSSGSVAARSGWLSLGALLASVVVA